MYNVGGGNYGSVGQQINKQNQTINAINMESSPDYGKMAEESIKGRSRERRAAIEAEARVHRVGLDAMGTKKLYEIDAQSDKDVAKIKAPAKRFAGVVGAAKSVAGAAVLKKFSDEQKLRDDERDRKYDEHLRLVRESYNRERPELLQLPDPPQYRRPDLETPPISGESGDGTQSGTKPQTYQSMSLAGSADVAKLTDDDFKHLAYAITSEAGGGKDRYGVAASILNRVASKDWPGTVKDVIFQNGQYQGVYEGKSTWSPQIAADLSSETGRAEILKALKLLDGRTDFKGQTMLKHRSNKGNKDYDGDGIPDMDPMLDSTGNFFHYSWQS